MTVTNHQTTENVELFRRIIEEILSGDLSAYNELFAEDLVVRTPFGTFDGWDDYRTYTEESLDVVSDNTCLMIYIFARASDQPSCYPYPQGTATMPGE